MFEEGYKLKPYYLRNLLLQSRKFHFTICTNDENIKKSLDKLEIPITLMKFPPDVKAIHQVGLIISVDDLPYFLDGR